MVKIYIISQNEPFYIPKMIQFILKNKNNYQVIGYTLLSPKRKNKSIWYWFKERARVYTTKELILSGLLFGYTKIINVVLRNSPYSVKSQFKKYNIKQFKTNDINSNKYIMELRKLNPDVIFSISCPQLFKEELLKVPNKYCINAHGTLLPRHRGVFGSFWTLFSNDKIGGSTIHTMDLKLDSGVNLWQEEFNVEHYDTQYSIAYKTKRQMAKGIRELLEKINRGYERPINPKHKISYHRAPTKEEGKKFHDRGHKIIIFKDIKKVLSKEFDFKN